MRRNIIRVGLASLVAAGAVAALPGLASATTDATPAPVGGRERVKVSVDSTEAKPLNCTASANGAAPVGFHVGVGGKQSVVIGQVVPGPGTVHVHCDSEEVMPQVKLDRTLPVTVALANPALDAIDSVFIGAGSSAFATDAALR
ncbi:hypothetical protein IRT45_20890 [Nocardia sp. BSTN01]|uniref:hypothetical protein n=1 Tax=Nocardia sp. BSTN01 TaxID=2783665 RepID=UPI0018903039|nr:hypothetical protein [Nocardia sp. BSTN01]MBF4999604.1 hypothetical protein [Nocardia sp. BSTN01]